MKRVCFDTSTLVAALVQKHPHHALVFPHLTEVHAGRIEGYVTTHGLAELFATLTALPLKPRLTGYDAQALIQKSILNHYKLIELDSSDYENAFHLTVSKNLSSGAIYDALHLIGARKTKCQTLYTLNLRHFQSLAPGDSLISTP